MIGITIYILLTLLVLFFGFAWLNMKTVLLMKSMCDIVISSENQCTSDIGEMNQDLSEVKSMLVCIEEQIVKRKRYRTGREARLN